MLVVETLAKNDLPPVGPSFITRDCGFADLAPGSPLRATTLAGVLFAFALHLDPSAID